MEGRKTLKSCLGRRSLFAVLVCLNMLVLTAGVADAADPNLITHWKLDEGSGGTAYDSAGDNDGTLVNGPVWTAGQVDGGLDFDGINDYVDCGNLGSFPSRGTIGFWMEADEIANYRNPFTTNFGGGNAGVRFEENGNGRFVVVIRYSSSGGVHEYVSSGLQAGGWYHVVLTWDSANNNVRGYLNGVEKFNKNHTNIWPTALPDVQIGRGYSTSASRHWSGKIDDVRIYDRALSAEEIRQLCQEGWGGRAFGPKPSDGARSVDPNVVLSWEPGAYADSHDVYFGIDFDDVNDATTNSADYIGRTDANSYWPGPLELGTSYYWRIDEVNDVNTNSPWKGDVWRFKTWADLVSWWRFNEGSGSTAYDSAGDNDGTISGAQWTSGQIGSALDFDGSNDYVDFGNDESLNITDEITIGAWVKTNSGTANQKIARKGEMIYMLMIGGTAANDVRFGLGTGSSWTVLLDTTGDYISTGT